jgi:hypothetical protein
VGVLIFFGWIGTRLSRRSGSKAPYVFLLVSRQERFLTLCVFLQPKLTITLLDSDDLRALAHLMNSYPSVLREKAILARAAATGQRSNSVDVMGRYPSL